MKAKLIQVAEGIARYKCETGHKFNRIIRNPFDVDQPETETVCLFSHEDELANECAS